ncbi:unnamed protein product [Effrenium voratum]|uniref:Uncharacterized protein n=1 Tax=Effrenium voratum TaxID=2562239 RepID=A0AA36N5V1_9DINO|nr:unnamed protein product [Effrenium voratum]CAJ1416010.1 unnamed protein product [Effrenium voratum]
MVRSLWSLWSLWILRLAAGAGQDESGPFGVVSKQIVQEECPGIAVPALNFWKQLQAHFFEAQSAYYSSSADSKFIALLAGVEGLNMLMRNLESAYACPILAARNFKLVGDWSTAVGHPYRARCLLQLGNIFKIQAMARWYNQLPSSSAPQRFESRLQVEFTIAITQLHAALQVPLRPLVRWPGGTAQPRIQVHSICHYRPDPSAPGECPLPQLSEPNHRAYAERHGYKYVLHTELPLPDREAHYSKMLVIHQAFLSAESPDWVFFIDCDAFFTDPHTRLEDILATYGAAGAGPDFLVAEDPGGINTGTMLVRRSEWSLVFLERVANSGFAVAWDQSMFFWEILNPSLLPKVPERSTVATDYSLPKEVALVHQAHLNAFVPPASGDWSAHEWRPGDFVRHFAGCPWQESHCLSLMRETAFAAQQQLKA